MTKIIAEVTETAIEALDRQIDWAVGILRGCSFVTDVTLDRNPDYVSICITCSEEDVNDSDLTVVLQMFPEAGSREYMRHEFSIEIGYDYDVMQEPKARA